MSKNKSPIGRRFISSTVGTLVINRWGEFAVYGITNEKTWEGNRLVMNKTFPRDRTTEFAIGILESDEEFAKKLPLGTRVKLEMGVCVHPRKLSFEYCRLQVLSRKKKANALMGSKKTNRSLKAMGRKARKIAGKKYGHSLMRKLIMEG